ncbi:hypothetical protein J2741_000315 [Methanolinea mesophila]|uniref:hypothetical protein n=1 Tax=Methanolinea mesophila TaxID=547055 RepID=UPI001AE2A420|nr:hypothetical protein [Methanolinea mesophila]MBP1927768.1 hypothetical protein [Methanolinea mesophila]
MKKILFVALIFILIALMASPGCLSNRYRSTNPDVLVTADVHHNGSYTRNYIDDVNRYIVTVNILNNGSRIARNVRIDEFSYCNKQKVFPYQNCIIDNGFLADIGDLIPREQETRYYNFERPAWIVIPDEHYQLHYRVSSEYTKVAPD